MAVFAKNYLVVGFNLDYVKTDGDLSHRAPANTSRMLDAVSQTKPASRFWKACAQAGLPDSLPLRACVSARSPHQMGWSIAFGFLFSPRGIHMPTLVVKNLPGPLHERLKAQAVEYRRSVTQEVIFVLEQGLLTGRRRAPMLLPPPYVLKGGPLTIDQIEAAIEHGRE